MFLCWWAGVSRDLFLYSPKQKLGGVPASATWRESGKQYLRARPWALSLAFQLQSPCTTEDLKFILAGTCLPSTDVPVEDQFC